MKIIIETPYGRIESSSRSEPLAEMEEWFKNRIAKITNLTIDTVDGPVIIPEQVLRNSLIRLIEG